MEKEGTEKEKMEKERTEKEKTEKEKTEKETEKERGKAMGRSDDSDHHTLHCADITAPT